MGRAMVSQVNEQLSHRHLNQLTELYKTTGRYEYVLLNNKLGLDVHEAIKINFVQPNLPYT